MAFGLALSNCTRGVVVQGSSRTSGSSTVAVQAFDHMHIFAVEIAANLVKPGVAVESPGVHHQGISIPMRDGLSRVGSVEVLQWSVLAPVNRNHPIHRLGGDQAALTGVDEDK